MLDDHAIGRDRGRYFHQGRSDFLDWLRIGPVGSVLEVGCGAGEMARYLRSAGAVRMVGIEVDESAARSARSVFDEVIELPVETALERLEEDFQLIVCADVLEHLIDPWRVVSQLKRVAADGAVLAVSIPNIRFLPALVRVAFGAGFKYERSGIFDSTHLRFFARPNVEEMLVGGGWRPMRWGGGPSSRRLELLRAMASAITRGGADQWQYRQTYVTATPERRARSDARQPMPT